MTPTSDPAALATALEALLLAAGQPLAEDALRDLLAGDATDTDTAPTLADVRAALAALGERLVGSGSALEMVRSASGVRLRIGPAHARLVARLWREKPPRLSRALLETLAVIAYRQPVTRADIEDVRGVAVAAPLLRALEDRDWIETVGRRDGPGRPQLFGTTARLLDDLGLASLADLPPLPDAGQPRAGEVAEPGPVEAGGEETPTP